ncbi:MAG: tRNA threonylcarbamoyladenosine biosynthesis protein TsaB [Cycloclasticus sp. symbiont of Poecilosclerida sp. N]|nr:MAG: tRNA threonylcarbamoyladenosine biosynthesis protein TsaB [Cycloclasticus sp. symbiont of Poecilosclerida sp. N]
MNVLAIETATEACSAALLVGSEVIDVFQIAPREHGNLILTMVDGLLNEAGMTLQQLDALAFGRGPGSFTGVRMATGVIQGLAFSADLPVAPVSTLTALAQKEVNSGEGQTIYAALDARMGEVYWCEYVVEKGRLKAISEEVVINPNEIIVEQGKNAIGIGHGWRAYKEVILNKVAAQSIELQADQLPRAKEVAHLAIAMIESKQTVSAENALPVYLRDNVAKKKAQQ